MANKLTYPTGAQRPDAHLSVFDDDGALIDFSTGYTFVFRIGLKGAPALLEKTSGITGAATEPNIAIEWATDELALPKGQYAWDLVATTASEPRRFSGSFQVLDVILPAI